MKKRDVKMKLIMKAKNFVRRREVRARAPVLRVLKCVYESLTRANKYLIRILHFPLHTPFLGAVSTASRPFRNSKSRPEEGILRMQAFSDDAGSAQRSRPPLFSPPPVPSFFPFVFESRPIGAWLSLSMKIFQAQFTLCLRESRISSFNRGLIWVAIRDVYYGCVWHDYFIKL